MRPKQNGRNRAGDIFKPVSLYDILDWNLTDFFPKGLVNNDPALVPKIGDRSLSEPMVV